MKAVPNSTRSRIGLVHLVRSANGIEPFVGFIESYRERRAGVEHDLVLAMKGFSHEAAAPYLRVTDGLQPEVSFVSDEGLDLDAYAQVARQVRRARYCFVNSYSSVLVDDWLAKLDTALSQPGVGLVGATGSWASPRSQALYAMGLPTAYRAAFEDRRWMRDQFRELQRERGENARGRLPGLRDELNTWRATFQAVLAFPPFPSPHLRTNAFMIQDEILAQLRLRRSRMKLHAYQLESGRRSITRQVAQLGLRVLVVDADGTTFDPEEWDRSRTFWQHDQEGLMVADNQTNAYARGDRDRRVLLSRYAWGARADPVEPANRAQTGTCRRRP